ncbi:MAG TPA: sulfurtransferase TusA family protein [Nitrososphaerales archaeon]|nr:sulfurtransferase TusA family protein [Nitrososphaerota archaeon]HIC83906.1 sulfurtransferase TusA family protein [Nitrososphaerales archaeon]HIM82567.1 sulfurtransferase TusA family protein [Nitrososphaerales archaeon]
MSQEDSSIKPDKTIDMKGLLCPEPVFRTKQTIKEMNIDEILEVFADDPVAEEDIKSWINKSENELLSFNKDDKLLKFLIRKVK